MHIYIYIHTRAVFFVASEKSFKASTVAFNRLFLPIPPLVTAARLKPSNNGRCDIRRSKE